MTCMSTSPRARVLLLAANGRTGRAVLRALAAQDFAVRAFVRRPEQQAALAQLGAAEIATGDLLQPESVERAAEGCDAVVYIGPPMHPDELQMATTAVRAAEREGCRHFVYYSVLHPVCRDIRHHRLKLEAEEVVVNGHVPYTIVQPARYMQHLEPLLPEVRATGVHAMPFAVDVRFNVVDLADLAEATATVTSSTKHLYGTFELAGPEALSQRDMAATLSRLLERTVMAQALSIEAMQAKARKAGASDDRIAQMTAMNRHYDAHGMRGNPLVLATLLGRAPTTFEQYAARVLQAAG